MKEKTPLLHDFVCFQMHIYCEWEITSFSKKYVISEGAVSLYLKLSIARHQVSFSLKIILSIIFSFN